jgi:hypothetical protein
MASRFDSGEHEYTAEPTAVGETESAENEQAGRVSVAWGFSTYVPHAALNCPPPTTANSSSRLWPILLKSDDALPATLPSLSTAADDSEEHKERARQSGDG